MPTRIRVVDRLADILECFTPEQPEWGVSELGARIGLDKATVCRILQTAKSRGLVSVDPKTQRYTVGPRILQLAQVALDGPGVRSRSVQYCYWLRERTGETAALTIRVDSHRLCIEQVESKHEVICSTEVGRPLPLYCGAAGKALLASMPDPEVEEYLSHEKLVAHTERTITDPGVLWAEIQCIRRQGYAVSLGERVVGSVTLAAPVRDHTGDVVAALSVAMPIMRYQVADAGRYVNPLLEAAVRLSADLGHGAIQSG
jgi:DNA-binding IclR family transcriptional regulator